MNGNASEPRRPGWACLLVGLAALGGPAAAADRLSFEVRVDLGADRGQNPGSLFEVADAAGRPILGAGFLGAYNTQDRSDRHVLHAFARGADSEPAASTLPRVNADSGVYLFDRAGTLYARSGSGGLDRVPYRWDAAASRWERADPAELGKVAVGTGTLEVGETEARYDGRVVLRLPEATGRIGLPYYAQGWLVFWNHFAADDPRVERLVACRWEPGGEATLDGAATLPLIRKGEYPYAIGQLGADVLATTNLGGVHRLRDGRWETIRPADPTTSYQVYAMLNVRDRLWLGQYPTGEIFEYDGERLRHLPGQPPRMPGVSGRAREAQTLTIYRGDVYAGVWPWGELWRFEPGTETWSFVRRMFDLPAPTDATTHPYERETMARGPVLNQWGQRVTSLVPLGGSLLVATSSKGAQPWTPAFDFLGEPERLAYGRVHRLTLPGHVSAPILWPAAGPTRFEVVVEAGKLRVYQDGRPVGESDAPAMSLEGARVTWGNGLYGPLAGTIEAARSEGLDDRAGPMRGVYLHLHQLTPAGTPPDLGRARIRAALDRMAAAGLRTVLPYANTSSGATLYPSERARPVVEGWSPLGVLVEEARARGLKVEPVLCTLVSGDDRPAGVLEAHPDWAVRDPEGSPVGYISPAHPEARAWVVGLAEELVRTFRPDGLLLDYLRYPNRPMRLDPRAEARLRERLAAEPPERHAALTQRFREDEITELARDLRRALRAIRPDLPLSIYSWGPHVTSGHRVAQPWPRWLDDDLIDGVNISGYCYPANYGDRYLDVLRDRLAGASALNRGRKNPGTLTLCLGLRTSHGAIERAEAVRPYLETARSLGIDGVTVFTWSSLDPLLDALVRDRVFDPPRPF